MKYAHLFAEIYNTPHMIHPGKAEIIESVFRGYATGNPPAVDESMAAKKPSISGEGWRIRYRNNNPEQGELYRISPGGVVILPVTGTLKNRTGGFDALSGLTSYQELSAKVRLAATEGGFKGILMDGDTPGGGVAGLYQFTDLLRATDFPIWLHANEFAFSAGYAIASATNRVIGARTSEVGSIGVIAMVADQSDWDKKRGVKYHTVYAGARKNDFNPHETIKPEALERLQGEVDHMYDLFVDHVATGRPMTEEQVRDTEADTFNASDAREIGLLDDIMNFEDAVHELEAYAANGSRVVSISQRQTAAKSVSEEKAMSDDKNTDATFTQADIDAAVASAEESGRAVAEQQVAEARAEARKEERTAAMEVFGCASHPMAAGILSAETEGKDAYGMIKHLSANTGKTTTGKSQFEQHMEGLNPDVGADTGDDGQEDDAALVQRLVTANHSRHGGIQ